MFVNDRYIGKSIQKSNFNIKICPSGCLFLLFGKPQECLSVKIIIDKIAFFYKILSTFYCYNKFIVTFAIVGFI